MAVEKRAFEETCNTHRTKNFFFFCFKKKEKQEFITLYDLGSGMQLINQWILDSPKI